MHLAIQCVIKKINSSVCIIHCSLCGKGIALSAGTREVRTVPPALQYSQASPLASYVSIASDVMHPTIKVFSLVFLAFIEVTMILMEFFQFFDFIPYPVEPNSINIGL